MLKEGQKRFASNMCVKISVFRIVNKPAILLSTQFTASISRVLRELGVKVIC